MSQLQAEILQILKDSKDQGLEDHQISAKLPAYTDEQRAHAYQALLALQRIQLFELETSGKPYFKYVSEETSSKLKDLSQEEQKVY